MMKKIVHLKQPSILWRSIRHEMSAKIHRYIVLMSGIEQYFAYVNVIHNLASNKQFNAKEKCLVSDFAM